jgi:hypothetical protein
MFDPSWKSMMQTVGMGACDGCKFWSELVATQRAGWEMQALCLNPNSHCYQKMVAGGCGEYVAGRSLDDPAPQEDDPGDYDNHSAGLTSESDDESDGDMSPLES